MADWFIVASCGALLLGAVKAASAQLQEWRRRRRRRVARGGRGAPLRQVVAACEARWFLEELKLAMDGDCEAMVRVGHMLLAGYGIKQDKAEAARWLRHAWAIQNYKEPAMMEMLDPEESAVPALNTQGSTASTAAAATAVPPPRPQSPAAADVGKQHGASGTGTTTTSSSGKADQRLVAVGRQGQHVGHGEQGAGPSAGCREQEGSLQHQQQRGRQRHRRRQGSRQQQDGAGIPQGRPGWAGLGPHVSGGTGGDGCSSSGVDGSTTVELPSIHALYSSLDYAGPPAPSPVHAAHAARAVRTAESGELQQQQQQQLWRHRDQEQVEPHSTRRLAQQKQPQQRHADLVQ